MMSGCRKCMGICGGLFLVFGLLFLLQDLGVWDFWGISWYTVLFVLMGAGGLAQRTCDDCMAMKKSK